VCQRVPQMPAGGTRGRSWSWAHLPTSHRARCMGSGVQKVLARNHGVEPHGARRALKKGNFSHKFFVQIFVKKKLSII
jgi:hypothetical protein